MPSLNPWVIEDVPQFFFIMPLSSIFIIRNSASRRVVARIVGMVLNYIIIVPQKIVDVCPPKLTLL
ncbi:hypothetical protein [Methylobacter tundripaludum]|uniref:Uncharacterized protein n=1 Tax=Methylobacter tundripaludum (strain ATCC BAA-1195 / DSM 17260 / SV96) TaxID=697282 RepID=G3IQG7_METTV|nr:hypothetical protein [Methylobacter tundripaludum]EGW22053.1 hypothetical protein Mettu_0850 [Methylobacter tundripaludum SV96]